MKSSKLHLFLLAAIAGAILPFAFAPFDIWPIALLSPALLLLALQPAFVKPWLAAQLGFVYGLGAYGVGVSWVFVSVHHYGNTDIPLAVLVTSVFVIILALFFALQGYCLKRCFRGNPMAFALLGFPSIWVLIDWLHSWLFTGFPWLFLGYSQLNTPLGGFAPLSSVYAVTLAVLLSSGALVILFQNIRHSQHKKIIFKMVALLVLLWGVGALLQNHDFTTVKKKYSVSLVQGNIDPLHKFPGKNEIEATEDSYGALTKPYWKSDLILWPESAIPLPLPYSLPYIKQLQKQAEINNTTLITGVQIFNEKEEAFNSLIALGMGKGIYHKYHLLPFGDFLPFDHQLRGLINFFDLPMSSFTAGSKDQPLITAGHLKLDPLICYEIIFPEQVRETLRDADAIITLSEDGWFGASWGPHQHLQIAQMRALETGRYVLRSTPTGITAIIDSKGKLASTIPQFTATVLNGTFESMKGNTPWVKIGLWPLLILLIICFIVPGRFTKKR